MKTKGRRPARTPVRRRRTNNGIRYPLRGIVSKRGHFHFSTQRKCFMLGRKAMRGVCSFVKSIAIVSDLPHSGSSGGGGWSGGGGGAKKGIYIHNQLKRIIDQRVNPAIKIKVHPFVTLIMRELVARRWMLVDADVPCWCLQSRMATKVDFVCRTADGVYVICELKTQMKSIYHTAHGKMKGLFEQIDATLHNQHQLQLLSTCILFNMTFPDKATTEGYIFHAEDDAHLHVYPLQTWAKDKTDQVSLAMRSYRFSNNS